MTLKEKATKFYDWLVNKVKGREIPTVILCGLLAGIGAVITSYLFRDIDLTFVKYFELIFSPLGFFGMVLGFIGYAVAQVATSTERVSILGPISATITIAATVFGGIVLLGESLNLIKVLGIVFCLAGVWIMAKNHSKK